MLLIRVVRKSMQKNQIKKIKKQFYTIPIIQKSFDVYIDKNPKDTIPIKYTTLQDVKTTIRKLKNYLNKVNILIREYGKLDNFVCSFKGVKKKQITTF